MGEIDIDSVYTLHNIATGNSQSLTVHIQSTVGDFMYGYPSQKELDEANIKFQKSRDGHAMISIQSESGAGPGMIALKSDTPMKVRVWTDTISRVQEGPRGLGGPSGKGSQQKKDTKDMSKNISVLLWVAVIIALLFVISKKK